MFTFYCFFLQFFHTNFLAYKIRSSIRTSRFFFFFYNFSSFPLFLITEIIKIREILFQRFRSISIRFFRTLSNANNFEIDYLRFEISPRPIIYCNESRDTFIYHIQIFKLIHILAMLERGLNARVLNRVVNIVSP